MNLESDTTILNSRLLPWDIRGLGVILDDALSAKRSRDVLGIISRDLVTFVKSDIFPVALRVEWENGIKKQLTMLKKAQKKLILQIQETYQKIVQRIIEANLSDKPMIAAYLKSIDEIFHFRKEYGHPPYYIIALGFLNGLGNELLKIDRGNILDGLGNIESFYSAKPYLVDSLCSKELAVFAELSRNFNLDNADVSWLPWFIFQRIKDCWTLPSKRFKEIELNYLSQKESLKSSHLLSFYNFWSDLKSGKEDFNPPRILTNTRMNALVRSMIRQLHVYAACHNELQSKDEIQSISLKLDGQCLCLIVKNSQESLIYLLKTIRYDKSPYKLISSLLTNPGKKIPLEEGISDSQNAANLLSRLGLKGILADIFISNTNRAVALFSKEFQFFELPEQQRLAFKALLSNLKPYIVK